MSDSTNKLTKVLDKAKGVKPLDLLAAVGAIKVAIAAVKTAVKAVKAAVKK